MKTNDTLTIAAIPLRIVQGDREANLKEAAAQAGKLTCVPDIIVLPELFATGYTNDAAEMHAMAESADGPTLTWAKEMSATHGAAMAGTYAALNDDGRYCNRAFFIEPDGHATFYDKRHLFSLSSEAQVFCAGSNPVPVIHFRGWNVAMSVCYDLRFPAWMRNCGYAYDIMLLPANWPVARAYALEHLLIARAIENQAPIVAANRGGSDAYGDYDGCSFAFDHMGKPVFGQGSATASFSLSSIRKARERFPAAHDADSFSIFR